LLPYPPQWLYAVMREIRPSIEVGWQIPVLLSIVYDRLLRLQRAQSDDNENENLANDENIAQQQQALLNDIRSNYETHVSQWLQQHQLTDRDMIDTFGKIRDEWMQPPHSSSWLEIHTFYPTVPQSLQQCRGTAALVTTKQHRFATALCRHAGISESALPDERIYGLGQYTNKAQVIHDYLQRANQAMTTATTTTTQSSNKSRSGSDDSETAESSAVIHFFEDRWPTLVKCLADDRLLQQQPNTNDGSQPFGVRVQFYLCAWGYCTAQELALAEAEPRVTVLQLDQFQDLVATAAAR